MRYLSLSCASCCATEPLALNSQLHKSMSHSPLVDEGVDELDVEPLAEFLAAKTRLQERMAGARADATALRGSAVAEQHQFDALLLRVRHQVAALVDPAQRNQRSLPDRQAGPSTADVRSGADGSHAPPSTPAEASTRES